MSYKRDKAQHLTTKSLNAMEEGNRDLCGIYLLREINIPTH